MPWPTSSPATSPCPVASVIFSIQNDLAVVSTALAESVDVSAVPMSASQITLALAEYGNAVITTALGRGTSFLDWDRLVANVVGFNAGISLDTLAQIALASATSVFFAFGDGSNTPAPSRPPSPPRTTGGPGRAQGPGYVTAGKCADH